MSPSDFIAITLLAPLVGAGMIWLSRGHPDQRDAVLVVTSVILFLLVATQVPGVAAGARPRLELLSIIPGVAIAFELEPLGMLFAAVAATLWIPTSFYAIGYMRGNHEAHQTRFHLLFAVALFAVIGIAFAANILTLFVFYEILTLGTYPLVTHKGSAEAMRAGRIYLGLLLGTSICFLLPAIIWTWSLTGTLEFRPGGILAGHASHRAIVALLLLFMFGTGKAALMPFHRWLPAAMVAPTPVSALLHAVAVVKAGVFTVLKIIVYVFGIDLLASTGASQWLMWVAAGTLLTASLVAMLQDDLKARLAYSTVSQLSYIVLGGALANAWGVIGGGLHIATHAVGKITLFFCAGAIYVATHKTKISQMDGIGRAMPVTMTAFAVGALSVIGLPPFGGSWSKWYLALGAAEADQIVLVGVLMVSSLLNVAYLMPVVGRAFFAPRLAGGSKGSGDASGIHEAPLLCVVPIVFTALGCIAMFVFAANIFELLAQITTPGR